MHAVDHWQLQPEVGLLCNASDAKRFFGGEVREQRPDLPASIQKKIFGDVD
jgi:hypothetical protein